MKQITNTLTIGYGNLLLISGILKCFGMLDTIKFSVETVYLNINNPISTTYIILFNFIGGGCLTFFGFKTMNYDKYIATNDHEEDGEKRSHNTNTLSGLVLFAGFYGTLVALWMLFRGLSMLIIFENNILDFIPLIIFVIIYYIPFGIIPTTLIFIKFSIHNNIKQRNALIAFHNKKKK